MTDEKSASKTSARPYRRDSDMAPGFSMAKILLSNALPRALYYPGEDMENDKR